MLTPTQAATLKTNITANLATVFNGRTIQQWLDIYDLETIAAFYNSPQSPQVDLWRPDIKVSEVSPQIVMSDYVALTAIRQNGYLALTQGDIIDATKANIRAGFGSIFGAASVTTSNLTALAKKPATKFENLYTVSNVCSLYNYVVGYQDILQAIQ